MPNEAMKVTKHRFTKPTMVDPDVLNASVDVIVAARNVLARRTGNRSQGRFTNRIPAHVLDELDDAIRAWDTLSA